MANCQKFLPEEIGSDLNCESVSLKRNCLHLVKVQLKMTNVEQT